MLETREAQRLEKIISSGRTKPLVIECSRSASSFEDEDRETSNRSNDHNLCVVKAFDLPEVTNLGLFNEVVGNLLARSFGIDTPAPCLVHLSNPFVEAANTVLKRHGLALRRGIASGCEYFRGGYSHVIPQSLSDEELEQATLIYAYDMLVQNPDRTVQRPNCATRSGRFKLFDFETAFSFLLLIGAQGRPWEVSKHGIGPRHLFFSSLLRRKHDLDWRPFIRSLERVNKATFDEMLEGLPKAWLRSAGKVRTHLLDVADNAHRFEVELQRSLL